MYSRPTLNETQHHLKRGMRISIKQRQNTFLQRHE